MPEKNNKNDPLKTIFRRLWQIGALAEPTEEILDPVLDWRQAENMKVSDEPCPHGSQSGKKLDCPECFEYHFLSRTVRN
jgi:hypothetical protein